MSIKDSVIGVLKNLPGKKINRKVVCIYIDDFGSIRIKNKQAYSNLKHAGLDMDRNRYARYDTLASTEDLQMIFDVLTSVKDQYGHPACFTPYVNIANPNFDEIRANGFQQYVREPFTETLKRYGSSHEGVYTLWKQGINNDIFYPAYNGTEHINVKRFMERLQANHRSTMLGFDNESVCVPRFKSESSFNKDSVVFYIEKTEENELLREDIRVGMKMFEELLGYRPKQFTPGAGCYSPLLHKALKEEGVEYINVQRFYPYPLGDGKFRRKFLYNGKMNEVGQKYIIRNCVFETFFDNCRRNDCAVVNCLKNIEFAFMMKAPAIISTHRVNYVGSIESSHRNYSLAQLKLLLSEIVKRWPDVEFMNGDQMVELL